MNINAIKARLNALQNNTKKSDSLWKPAPGKYQVRIVPYKFNRENPFIELFFHYNINNKTYLSPISFGRPDPIVEFAEKLKKLGDTENWKAGKKMEPKLRTFCPIIVRGQENEGVKFWGFGKTVYEEILAIIADPDYGDITDSLSGRDIVVEVLDGAEIGKTYNETRIRVKPNQTKLSDNEDVVTKVLENQKEITEIYSELTYPELKGILENWLDPSKAATDEEAADSAISAQPAITKPTTAVAEALQPQPKKVDGLGGELPNDLPWDDDAKPTTKIDVEAAFDDLF
jgi:hypothetical protein